KVPTLDTDFGKGVSVFVAMQQTKNDTCSGYFEASNGPEIDDIHFGDWENALLYEVQENWVNDRNYPLLLGTPEVTALIQEANMATHVRRNSNGVGEGQVNLAPTATREQVFIGKSLYADCTPYNGIISEMIVYSRAVTDPELVQIETYLQNKWGC